MRYFTVPSDFKKETIAAYAGLNHVYDKSSVFETFGNITVGGCLESGRSVNMIPQVDMKQFGEYVEFSRKNNIGFNYTLNATHMNNKEFTKKGALEIFMFLDKLIALGVSAITVTLPSLIELIAQSNFDFELVASTICSIDNVNKALAHRKKGIRRIVLGESMNRKFDNLKRICSAVDVDVEVIVNTICHKNCIYRSFHYNQIASDSINVVSDASANFYSHRCVLQRYDEISNLLRLSWIRPEDLKYYEDCGVKYYKIQGRQTVLRGDPLKTVEAYFKESFDGNLMELLDQFDPTNQFKVYVDNKKLDGYLKPFLLDDSFCKNDCHRCKYCDNFAKKVIDYDKAGQIVDAARKFYTEYDQFNVLRDSLTKSQELENKKNKQDSVGLVADFDL